MKNALLVLVAVLSSSLVAVAAPKAPLMSHYDGKLYCQDQGKRLPKPREVAEMTTAFGGAVVDTAYPGAPTDSSRVTKEIEAKRSEGFIPYLGYSDGEEVVAFYFKSLDPDAFRKPPFDNRIWTSVFSGNYAVAYSFGSFRSFDRRYGSENSLDQISVICVAK